MKRLFFLFCSFLLLQEAFAQQTFKTGDTLITSNENTATLGINKYVSLIGYGRIGIGTSLEDEHTGFSLNLEGQGRLGGRFEETDYIEQGAILNLNNLLKLDTQKPKISLQFRAQMFSGDNSFIVNNTVINMAEAFIQVDSLFDRDASVWLGQRFFRGPDIQMADYFNWNNLTGQGFAFRYKQSTLAMIATFPFAQSENNPYGDNFDPLRERYILNFQQGYYLDTAQKHLMTGLMEVHSADNLQTSTNFEIQNTGWVFGLKHEYTGERGFYNEATIRYGTGIANGPRDDGWSSRTFITLGYPDVNGKFKGAFSWHITDQIKIHSGKRMDWQAYFVYRNQRGAKDPVISQIQFPYADSIFPVPNRKWDFSIGVRPTIFLNKYLHLVLESQFQMREYIIPQLDPSGNVFFNDLGVASMTKFSIVPTFVPSAQKDAFGRPHIRLIYSLAFYNQVAKDNKLSEYLQQSNNLLGQYFGVRTEWWF